MASRLTKVAVLALGLRSNINCVCSGEAGRGVGSKLLPYFNGNNKMELALQIAQLVGPLVIALGFIFMIKSDVKVLGVRLDSMNDNLKVLNNSFEKLGNILTKVAVQDQRLLGLEEDIRELKHGKGFISVDGEYRNAGKVSG